MIKFALCVALGVVGHQTSPLFNLIEARLDGNGLAWPRIGRYSVGGVLIWAASLFMLDGDRHDRTAVSGAISSGLIALGAGVAMGYVLDLTGTVKRD